MQLLVPSKLISIFILGVLINAACCHVSLDFPPARDLSLDFLDTFRTPAPCGMPKQKSKMSLVSGSTINVTWHLGYPHQGGFRIDLLNKDENVILSFTPKTARAHTRESPSQAAQHSGEDFRHQVLLLRQATEQRIPGIGRRGLPALWHLG